MLQYTKQTLGNNWIHVETEFRTVPVDTTITKQTQILFDSHAKNANSFNIESRKKAKKEKIQFTKLPFPNHFAKS